MKKARTTYSVAFKHDAANLVLDKGYTIQDCLNGFETSEAQAKTIKQQAKLDKAEIKSLQRELRYKEKALAETTALLVLRKKLNALWEDDSEEN